MFEKVVTFGEIMLRLSTPEYSRFVQSQNFDVTYGGGEANVAVSLSNYGLGSYFLTKLPKHEIGQSAVNHLRRFGVKTDFIIRGGNRVGIYFLETGASQRPSKVIYDRAGSSVSEINKSELDWKEIFKDAKWFHWTGITPAIGKNLQEYLTYACKYAKDAGATVSCDLNFRAKLWTEKEAQAVMMPLMDYVDVCIANEEDSEKSLGIKNDKSKIEEGKINIDEYFDLARKLKSKYNFKAVSITLRESFSASRNGWSAVLLDDKDCVEPYRSKLYDISIIDRVGGGDSFASGLIYGLLKKDNTKEALEFAVAASCLKQTIPGDFNLVSVEEVEKLAKGSGSGRVER
ncbi:MAG: sugar kinase [Ignavibacteria bacterium]|jgi:2-dehydro-3-deoxygluconokinase